MKTLTQYAPAPTARHRRKAKTGKAFRMAATQIAKRAPVQEAVHRAIAYLWDTLDWLNPWQQDAGSEHGEELHDEAQHLSLHL